MESIFSLNNLFTLGMLTLLQAVLGFDNLLYISLESKRAPLNQQAMHGTTLGYWYCDCTAYYTSLCPYKYYPIFPRPSF